MVKKLSRILIICLVFVMSSALVLPGIQAAASSNWSGVWDTDYGKMVLQQNGKHISGTYEYNGGGRVEGTITGNIFRGTWYEPGNSGTLKFAISDDGMIFRGFWNGDSPWNGAKRSYTVVNEVDDWSGAWDTSFGMMILQQNGNHISGTYEYNGGSRVEGTITGDVFNGTWYEPENSGTLKFTMSDDGMAFTGFWDRDGIWDGSRRR